MLAHLASTAAGQDSHRGHQAANINMLAAATEYSSDATLNTAKFASRALASNVTSRRLVWLRHWQADMRSKWRLVLAPFKGGNHFGDSLDPVLVEDREKRKVLPSSYRRTDRRSSPYFHRQSFWAVDPGFRASPFQRQYPQAGDRSQERQSFHDRGRQQPYSRWPFRLSGNRSYHRSK